MYRFLLLGLLFLSFFGTSFSQDSLNEQWEIRHDNDFLFFTDRYYSAGSFVGYRKVLSNPIFSSSEREQWSIEVGQETYTPTLVKETDIAEFDRPYAGYLGAKLGWTLSRKRTHLNTILSLGVAGPASGAGAFQQWYHRAIVTTAESPTWIAEIENGFHANLYIQYAYEWKLSENPFSVHIVIHPEVAFGTRDSYVQPEILFHLGRRNALSNSIAYEQVGSMDKELFMTVGVQYRAVFYDALLEGHPFKNNSPFTVTPEEEIMQLRFGLSHRFERNDYKFLYHFTTKASALQTSHSYLSLAYARTF